ncbi:MAG: oligosaccharide flippase family protein [Melioribacteraceae bacterium]|nr:oligosaccharide flippase family protein [Melioribacteraceae bacterium]
MIVNYFKKGLTLYFLGNFSSKVISLLLLPLFTFYLTQEEYGLFDILNTIVLFMVPVIGAQIFEGVIRYLLDTNDLSEKSKIISSSFYFLLINIIIVNVILLAVKSVVDVPFAGWLLLYFNFYMLNFYLQRIARGLQLQKVFALSGLLNTIVIAVISVVLLTLYDYKTDGLLIAYAGGAAASFIYLLKSIGLLKYLSLKFFNKTLLKKLLIYSLPLLFDAIIWWTMNLSDRLLLGYFQGTEEVGIYAVSNRFAALLTFLNHIFYLVWQEFAIIRAGEEGNKEDFAKILLQYLRIQFTGVILMMPAVKLFIEYFVDASFHSAYLYVPVLLVSAMFSSFAAFYGLFYQVEKNTKGALYTSLISGIINIVLNIIFIPIYGIWAAAVSTLISFALLWSIRVFVFRSYKLFSSLFYKHVIIGIIVGAIAVFLYYQQHIYFDLTNLLLAGVLFFFVNKTLLGKLIWNSERR